MISMNAKLSAILAALSVGVSSVRAAVVYDLSSGPVNSYYQSFSEFGDQLVLAGADRVIESFSFDYFANFAQAGGLTFRIYANDGPIVSGSRAPGTILDARVLDISNIGGSQHVLINYPFNAANVLPNSITYTATFSGIGNGSSNRAGLITPGGFPSTGASFDDAWQRTGTGAGDWALIHVVDNNGLSVIANFKATVTAVPEPGTVALFVLGGLGLVVAARRKN